MRKTPKEGKCPCLSGEDALEISKFSKPKNRMRLDTDEGLFGRVSAACCGVSHMYKYVNLGQGLAYSRRLNRR